MDVSRRGFLFFRPIDETALRRNGQEQGSFQTCLEQMEFLGFDLEKIKAQVESGINRGENGIVQRIQQEQILPQALDEAGLPVTVASVGALTGAGLGFAVSKIASSRRKFVITAGGAVLGGGAGLIIEPHLVRAIILNRFNQSKEERIQKTREIVQQCKRKVAELMDVHSLNGTDENNQRKELSNVLESWANLPLPRRVKLNPTASPLQIAGEKLFLEVAQGNNLLQETIPQVELPEPTPTPKPSKPRQNPAHSEESAVTM